MFNSNRGFEGSVHVRGRPVKEVHHRGRTYIEGRKATEYTLHFKNNTNKPVLVIPSVDGLCVIDGKPAGRNSPGFLVQRHASIDIPGWMVDKSTAAKFTFWPQDARGEATYVEELSKSGATVDMGNQGLIGFLILEEHFTPTLRFTGGQPNPKDAGIWKSAGFRGIIDTSSDMQPRGVAISGSGSEVMSQNLGYNASSANTEMHNAQASMSTSPDAAMGTKFGESTDFNTTDATFNRGAIVGEIVLEYDTLRGLKDRGVSVDLFKGPRKRYDERQAFPEDTPKPACTPPKDWKKPVESRKVTDEDIEKLTNLPATVSAEFYMKNVLGWSDEMIAQNAELLRKQQNGW